MLFETFFKVCQLYCLLLVVIRSSCLILTQELKLVPTHSLFALFQGLILYQLPLYYPIIYGGLLRRIIISIFICVIWLSFLFHSLPRSQLSMLGSALDLVD